MKILKIEFENINSLKGFHEIDFSKEPFLTNSLFAITGPTGSGKSSILDVISLALFNHVPRLGKITKNEILAKGAILTRNQKNAMARVTYECKNGVFSSQWSIEVNRNNNLNDYEMEIHDHHSGKLLDLKKSLVPTKNEELIGLNYDQFIKAVLLAQGEFAQFLKAKKEERGELLEKITGTGIYRKLGIKAFEKNKDANRDIQKQQNEIQVLKQDLLSDEVVESNEKELQQKIEKLEKQQKDKETMQKSIALKTKIQEHKSEIETRKKQEDNAIAELKTFDAEHGFPLKQHEKVQEKSDELRAWNQLNRDLAKNKSTSATIEEDIKRNLAGKENLLKQARELTKDEISEEKILDSLNQFRDKVLKLQENRSAKLNSYSAKKDQLNSELRETSIQLENQQLEDFILMLKNEFKNTSEDLQNKRKDLGIDAQIDLQQKQQELKARIGIIREAASSFRNIESETKEINRLEKEIAQLEPSLKNLPKIVGEETKQLEDLQKDFKILSLKRENQKLKASLEEHRENLIDGEPCPLCGALHHPFAEEMDQKENDLEKQILVLQPKIEKLQKELSQHQAEFTNLQNNLKKFQEKLVLAQEKRQLLKVQFIDRYKDLSSLETSEAFESYAQQLDSKLEKLAALEKQQKRNAAFQMALPLAADLQDIIAQGKQISKELESLYSGENIQNETQEISNKWSRIQQGYKDLQERKAEIGKSIAKQDSELTNLEKELASFASEKGFETIENTWQALIPEVEAAKLRNEQQQITKRIEDSRSALKLLGVQLQKMQEDDSPTSLEELNTALRTSSELFIALDEERIQIKRKLDNQKDYLKRMASLQLEIAEKEKQTRRWRLLNELIGDSKGKSFNDFAQDLTLSRLINLANIRLKDLSDRYIIDKPTEEEDDGLVAIDEHMGGQRRSVKTLSGGETFILSLSMALALSDLASKNVEINSLFIDEGFGTLDPETLDQTLDTLEKLQAESSKTIGIISHVDSLKERISTQIQLTRNGQGYSSLAIK